MKVNHMLARTQTYYEAPSAQMYQVTRLPNGLTIATAQMPYMASVSLGVWVGVGGRHEPAELSGISHFIEHMLFKGTRKRSAKDISQAVEGIGGYLNAFTTEEVTCYFFKARHDRFEVLLDVLMDMVLNSVFDPVEIKKERNVIKEELAMYLDQPQQYVHELLNETLWPDQPLGRSLTGTQKTLDTINQRRLFHYQRANYVATNTLVTAAGQLEHREVVEAVSLYASRFSQGRRPQFLPAANRQVRPAIRLFPKKTEQSQLALGIRACSRHDDRRYALRILNAILGENMSSRLFQVVREEYGLAYCIGSHVGLFDDVGALTISAGVDAGKLSQALKLMAREMKRLTEKPPTVTELRRARDYVIGQLDLSLESTENQMTWLGEQILGYGKIVPAETIKDQLNAVKPRHVRDIARQFFRPERLSLAIISPLRKKDGLTRLLEI
jgi:predicted Zn-dependent peptidase